MSELTGEVKWFSNERGYGFITEDGGETEYFVHFSSIDMEGYKTLKAGQKVSFTLKETDKGIQAVDIKVPRKRPGRAVQVLPGGFLFPQQRLPSGSHRVRTSQPRVPPGQVC